MDENKELIARIDNLVKVVEEQNVRLVFLQNDFMSVGYAIEAIIKEAKETQTKVNSVSEQLNKIDNENTDTLMSLKGELERTECRVAELIQKINDRSK